MTPTKYFIARVALAFGVQRRNQRMADAASETHLLRDAELHLGLALWEQCEQLEDLSVEYWNTRKLVKEIATKQTTLDGCQARLAAAHEERTETLLAVTSDDPEVAERRTALVQELDDLAARRDGVIVKARRLRRVFDGFKAKLDVLIESGTDERQDEVSECKQRMRNIKTEFDELKIERTAIAAEIDAKETQLHELERKVSEVTKERRTGASQAFQLIGEFNQEVATLNAEIGLLSKRKLELCAEIGRYLSRNAATNPTCATICKSHRGLIDIMAALRRSISFNHRVAGF